MSFLVGDDMPIYKRCDRCHKRLTPGIVCSCIKQRHKEYDKQREDKDTISFYHTDSWLRIRDKAIDRYNGTDIYSYYINGTIEQGHTVHHIVPIKDDWSKRLDIDNLIYLTESNHQEIHKRMRQGEYQDMIDMLNGLVERYKAEFA